MGPDTPADAGAATGGMTRPASSTAARPLPADRLADVAVLLPLLLALHLLVDDLRRLLLVGLPLRRLRLHVAGGLGLATEFDEHREVVRPDVRQHAQVDQLELVGVEHVVERE